MRNTYLQSICFKSTPFVIKGCGKRYRWTSRWKRCIGQGIREGVRSFHAMSLWACHSLSTSMCSPTCKLSELYTLRIFREASSCRYDVSLTPFPAPLPSLENGKWGWKFQASNHGLIFLVTSLHPGAHPESPQNKRHCQHPRNPKTFRNWSQRPNIRTKDAPSALIT